MPPGEMTGVHDTAGAANSWYHAGNPTRNPELAVLVEDAELRAARLALSRAEIGTVIDALRELETNPDAQAVHVGQEELVIDRGEEAGG